MKMQKRKQGDCPMCRAPSVLVANRSRSFIIIFYSITESEVVV